jgi:hypothetical protein
MGVYGWEECTGGGQAVHIQQWPGRGSTWPWGLLPGKLEIDPLVERHTLLGGLYGQGTMESFWHTETQLSAKRAFTQWLGNRLT